MKVLQLLAAVTHDGPSTAPHHVHRLVYLAGRIVCYTCEKFRLARAGRSHLMTMYVLTRTGTAYRSFDVQAQFVQRATNDALVDAILETAR